MLFKRIIIYVVVLFYDTLLFFMLLKAWITLNIRVYKKDIKKLNTHKKYKDIRKYDGVSYINLRGTQRVFAIILKRIKEKDGVSDLAKMHQDIMRYAENYVKENNLDDKYFFAAFTTIMEHLIDASNEFIDKEKNDK